MTVEYPRQALHFVCSILLAALAGILSQQWFLLLSASLLFVGSLAVYFEPRFLRLVLHIFDRRSEPFAGRGAFMVVLGAFLTVLLFPAQAVAALLVLAIADSASTIIGTKWGAHSTPWSAKKSWEGVAAFFVCSSLVLVFFSPWWLLIAALGAFAEAVDYSSFSFLDDNLVVPLVVASALVLF